MDTTPIRDISKVPQELSSAQSSSFRKDSSKGQRMIGMHLSVTEKIQRRVKTLSWQVHRQYIICGSALKPMVYDGWGCYEPLFSATPKEVISFCLFDFGGHNL